MTKQSIFINPCINRELANQLLETVKMNKRLGQILAKAVTGESVDITETTLETALHMAISEYERSVFNDSERIFGILVAMKKEEV